MELKTSILHSKSNTNNGCIKVGTTIPKTNHSIAINLNNQNKCYRSACIQKSVLNKNNSLPTEHWKNVKHDNKESNSRGVKLRRETIPKKPYCTINLINIHINNNLIILFRSTQPNEAGLEPNSDATDSYPAEPEEGDLSLQPLPLPRPHHTGKTNPNVQIMKELPPRDTSLCINLQ